MLDDRVRAVLDRLEAEDAAERELGLPSEVRARAIAPTTGRFLFALVAPQNACEVLEIGGSRGYSTILLAARARPPRGRVVSLGDPAPEPPGAGASRSSRIPRSERPGEPTSPRPGSTNGRSWSRATHTNRCPRS